MMRYENIDRAGLSDVRVILCPNCGTPMRLQRTAQQTSPVAIHQCRMCNITCFDPVYDLEVSDPTP
jgi:hypothetical protein